MQREGFGELKLELAPVQCEKDSGYAGVYWTTSGNWQAVIRVERAGIVHAGIGKAGMPVDQIRANLLTLVGTLVRLKPASAKGAYMRSIALSTTMGVGVRIDPNEAVRLAAESR